MDGVFVETVAQKLAEQPMRPEELQLIETALKLDPVELEVAAPCTTGRSRVCSIQIETAKRRLAERQRMSGADRARGSGATINRVFSPSTTRRRRCGGSGNNNGSDVEA
jgi:hypothetical protein